MQTENYHLSYRYIPGALGTHSSLDHGAVMTVAYRYRRTARNALRRLMADPRIQWVEASGAWGQD